VRLNVGGEYATDWPAIARSVKEDAGWRCVRCKHPFDPTTSRVRPCDDGCDATRGRLIRPENVGLISLSIQLPMPYSSHPQPHAPSVPGLSFTVHHFDGRKDNNAWWNLMALCNSCHLTIQGRVIPERPWLFEHSAWMVHYVCGFYAYYYGQQQITRVEAIEEPDRWLALGQPWRYEVSA
jgi:5-methylcytosine-specific restriction endonuclease McrA